MIKNFLALSALLASIFCFSPASAIAQSAEYYSDRGDRKYDDEDYISAIADYSRALELEPNNFYYYHMRGLSKYFHGDEESSIGDFTKAIQHHPDFPQSYAYRGQAKYFLDQCSSAISDLSVSIQLDPEHREAYYYRAACYNEMELYDNAYKDAVKLTRDGKADQYDYLVLGIASAYSGNEQQALKALAKSIAMDSEFSDAYVYRGIVYENLGKMQKACNDWINAGKLGSSEANSWVQDQCQSGQIRVNNQSTSKPTLRDTLSDTPFQWKQ